MDVHEMYVRAVSARVSDDGMWKMAACAPLFLHSSLWMSVCMQTTNASLLADYCRRIHNKTRLIGGRSNKRFFNVWGVGGNCLSRRTTTICTYATAWIHCQMVRSIKLHTRLADNWTETKAIVHKIMMVPRVSLQFQRFGSQKLNYPSYCFRCPNVVNAHQ